MSRSKRKSARVAVVEGGPVEEFDAVAFAASLAIMLEPVRMLQKSLMYLLRCNYTRYFIL
jgi:hypothetical protein